MNEPTIVKAWTTEIPESFNDFSCAKMLVRLTDGSEHVLFNYYPDEISFNPTEFVNLTIEEAKLLRRKKDIEFLQQ